MQFNPCKRVTNRLFFFVGYMQFKLCTVIKISKFSTVFEGSIRKRKRYAAAVKLRWRRFLALMRLLITSPCDVLTLFNYDSLMVITVDYSVMIDLDWTTVIAVKCYGRLYFLYLL